MGAPAKVLAAGVIIAGFTLTVIVLVLDAFSEHPSSTAVLVPFFVGLYVVIVVVLIAVLDWVARRAFRRPGEREQRR